MEIGSKSPDYRESDDCIKQLERGPMMKHAEDYWEIDAKINGRPFVPTDKSELIESTKTYNLQIRDSVNKTRKLCKK